MPNTPARLTPRMAALCEWWLGRTGYRSPTPHSPPVPRRAAVMRRLVAGTLMAAAAAVVGIGTSGANVFSFFLPEVLCGFLIVLVLGSAGLGLERCGLAARALTGTEAWTVETIGAVRAFGSRLRRLSLGFGALSLAIPVAILAHGGGGSMAVAVPLIEIMFVGPVCAAVGTVCAHAVLTAANTATIREPEGGGAEALWLAAPILVASGAWVWAAPSYAGVPLLLAAALTFPLALGAPVHGRAGLAMHLRGSREPLAAAGSVVGLIGVLRMLSHNDRAGRVAADLAPAVLGAIVVVTALTWTLPRVARFMLADPDERRWGTAFDA